MSSTFSSSPFLLLPELWQKEIIAEHAARDVLWPLTAVMLRRTCRALAAWIPAADARAPSWLQLYDALHALLVQRVPVKLLFARFHFASHTACNVLYGHLENTARHCGMRHLARHYLRCWRVPDRAAYVFSTLCTWGTLMSEIDALIQQERALAATSATPATALQDHAVNVFTFLYDMLKPGMARAEIQLAHSVAFLHVHVLSLPPDAIRWALWSPMGVVVYGRLGRLIHKCSSRATRLFGSDSALDSAVEARRALRQRAGVWTRAAWQLQPPEVRARCAKRETLTSQILHLDVNNLVH